ncbi:MAG TPA: hypothetical protein VFE86_00520, partial [Ilumatobacteraceae bacterium]|nr:hypothetical protein [Ilumatobacteraceae bacterium]
LVLAVSLLWFAPRWPAAAVVAGTVVYAGAVSIAVNGASTHSLVAIERGPLVTICGLTVLTAGTVAATAFDISDRPGRREVSNAG